MRVIPEWWRLRRLAALQLASGRPPEVRAAYERLRTSDISASRARRLLRDALQQEIHAMRKEARLWDAAAYAERLAALPSDFPGGPDGSTSRGLLANDTLKPSGAAFKEASWLNAWRVPKPIGILAPGWQDRPRLDTAR